MRQKELRLALVCYGGISLAVYMHGITKEVWRLARASRNFHEGVMPAAGSQGVYRALLEHLAEHHGLKLRVLPDIITGASAGGINGIFLAQAIATGQSLEPLTQLWLDHADIDTLLDPDARPSSVATKFWAEPLVWAALKRPGNVISRTVAKETRSEVRAKLSRLIRARWFAPPFGGETLSSLLLDAFDAMAAEPAEAALLPDGHPLDLFVSATDFHGHLQTIRLHSPPSVQEGEHRLNIGFRTVAGCGEPLAASPELAFAARATASFPGAFPPCRIDEIDALLAERDQSWPSREAFLDRVMPASARAGSRAETVLIDGAVLSNAPFGAALKVLKGRPAHREVDRRFVYIDPTPELPQPDGREPGTMDELPGFFRTIFGALSNIPREQPVRDDLEAIESRSRRIARLRRIIDGLRPDIESRIEALFGLTFFIDRPTPARLAAWRAKAQLAAVQQSGFAYAAYARAKLAGVVETTARSLAHVTGSGRAEDAELWEMRLLAHLAATSIEDPVDAKGAATPASIAFFRAHDVDFRLRRLRFVARRLAQDIGDAGVLPPASVNAMQEVLHACLTDYAESHSPDRLAAALGPLERRGESAPEAWLEALASARDLTMLDATVDTRFAEALSALPQPERRSLLLAYLGYPFVDIATLPLLQGEGLAEFDPVRVDRIAPDDAQSLRSGGARETLRGVEFYFFGAFFSRAYRENDYLWGRLHGAERLIDIVASAVEGTMPPSPAAIARFKARIFQAILDEERGRLLADPDMIAEVAGEVETYAQWAEG